MRTRDTVHVAAHMGGKIIVTGRTGDEVSQRDVFNVLSGLIIAYPNAMILTGTADGADKHAISFAEVNDLSYFCEDLSPGEYPEAMHRYNEWLLNFQPNVVVAFTGDDIYRSRSNRGTDHMISQALERAKCHVIICNNRLVPFVSRHYPPEEYIT